MAETYSFCESSWAGPNAPWHLRQLSEVGRKLGGGADTVALCGREVSWDLEVELTEHHLSKNTCAVCLEAFRANTNVTSLHALVCGDCKKPISKGQEYREVRLPGGSTTPIHRTCLEKSSR